LLNDILRGYGDGRGLYFVGTWVRYFNAFTTLIFGGFRGPFEKWWSKTIFKRVLDIIRHLKGENKWESSRRLDSNGLDIGSYWRAQSNDLIFVLGHNIAFSSKRTEKIKHTFRMAFLTAL